MVEKIRRVVTGHNEQGRSIFISDGDAPTVKEMESMPGLALTDLWKTNESPTNNQGNDEATGEPVVLEPSANGTIFRIVEFPPDDQWRGQASGADAFDSIGAGHAADSNSEDPMMHKTNTIDYLIVVKGEIWAILDDDEVCLKQGDVMVQRGTNHSWSVRTSEPCLLAAVLVNANPV